MAAPGKGRRDMRRSIAAPIMVALFSVAAGGWLLQEGVDRAENVYVRVRVLQEVVDRVESSFVDEVDASRLYDSAIDGLIRDLGDPHSSFMPASQFENLRIRTEGEYGGVGLEVVQRNGYVTVVSPIPGGPGGRMGIRAGDQFFEIEGVPADTMVTDQAVELLRGREGTVVHVKMLRPGVDEPIDFQITREVIRLRAVPFATMLDDGDGIVIGASRVFQDGAAIPREGMKPFRIDVDGTRTPTLEHDSSRAGRRMVRKWRTWSEPDCRSLDHPRSVPVHEDLGLAAIGSGLSHAWFTGTLSVPARRPSRYLLLGGLRDGDCWVDGVRVTDVKDGVVSIPAKSSNSSAYRRVRKNH